MAARLNPQQNPHCTLTWLPRGKLVSRSHQQTFIWMSETWVSGVKVDLHHIYL